MIKLNGIEAFISTFNYNNTELFIQEAQLCFGLMSEEQFDITFTELEDLIQKIDNDWENGEYKSGTWILDNYEYNPSSEEKEMFQLQSQARELYNIALCLEN